LPLIEHIALKGKPMIISTGMSEMDEIRETVNLVKSMRTPLIITHCVSIYPCPYDMVNLGTIPRYMEEFQIPVGLSDHSRGIYTSIGSVALGSCVIEKHFSLDKMRKGPDHPSSIEPYELGELVKGARAVFEAMGDERKIFKEEKQIAAWARESVVSETVIPKGTRITQDMVWVKRPGPGPGAIPAKDFKKVIGKTAAVEIPKDTQLLWEQLQ
jgi:sialic acid synthase SpsE